MQALYLKDGELAYKTDHPQPEHGEGEALVRVTLAGICSTDLELVKGYYPFQGILGHEFVGVVEKCDSELWIGRRVVSNINISPDCNGECGAARCPEHCPKRTVLGIVDRDGIFADWAVLPVKSLLAVPDSISDERAVFTEPLAAASRILDQIDVKDQSVAVIGPGRLGMLVAQVLRHGGATATVIGRSEPSLELAKDFGFATAFSDAPTLPTFDTVVEVTGNPAGFKLAVDLVRPQGTIVLKSTYAHDPDWTNTNSFASMMATVVVNEIQLIGSRCGNMAKGLSLLENDIVRVEPLIQGTYSLADGPAAFEQAAQPGVRKILLTP